MKRWMMYLIIGSVIAIFVIIAIVVVVNGGKALKQKNEEEVQVEQEENNSSQVEVKKKLYTLPEFNANNCSNLQEGAKYKYNITEEKYGMIYTLSENRKNVLITIDPVKVKELFDVDIDEKNTNVKVNNFGGKIVDIYADSLDHKTIGYEVILFLMEDGTIEYIPLYKALKEDDLKSYGKVPVAEDIVSLFTVDVKIEVPKEDEEDEEDIYDEDKKVEDQSYKAPAAIKNDGTFYDLSKYLYNTGNFKVKEK